MDVVVWVVIGVLLLIATAAVTAVEASTSLLPRPRVRRLLDSDRRGARALDALAEAPSRIQAAGSAMRAVAFALWGLAGAAIGMQVTAAEGWSWASVLGAAIAVTFAFSVGDALPRTLAVQNPEGVGLAFAPVARIVSACAYPLAQLGALPWRAMFKLTGAERAGVSPWATEEEYKSGNVPDEEAARDETEEALLDAVSEFTEKVVREVMVPRTDMASLPDTASILDAIEMIEARGYSRLPLYHETVDDVRGVLYAKDLLAAIGKGRTIDSLANIARPPYFVPETKPVDELFVEMRAKTHIAIVADEYGGTAGIVTIEDLLEELVGEIFDEYDREETLVLDLGDGRYRVDARLPIDDANELLGTDVDVDADTIGGVVSVIAGRIPDVGESFEMEGLRLTVLEREGTRVRQLEIESVPTAEDEESNDA